MGRAIVEQLLIRGDDVTVFARGNYPALEALGAALIRGDLQDAAAVSQACAGVDAVFHVAAKTDYWGSWKSFYGPNVTGTQNVIAACRRHAVPKLIFTSSPSVVANGQNRSGVDESTPYPDHFESYYPHTKMLAEKLVLNANCPELLTAALRPHVVFGPRDTHIIPRLIDRALSGKLFRVGNGTNKLDVTYIDDAARAHLQAADSLRPGSAVAGSAYFISQDEPVNLWGFVNDLLAKLNAPPVERGISLPAARAIGSALEFIYRTFRLPGEPRITRFVANELALDHYFDISKAKQEFGYRPQSTLEQAVEITVEYFKHQGAGGRG